MHGPDPLWFGSGTLLIATVVGGMYLLLRPDLTDDVVAGDPESVDTIPTARTEDVSTGRESNSADPADLEPDAAGEGGDSLAPEANPSERVLDLLPEDEHRILEPVLDSPGITQIKLRDRSDFSKSKVSQTVTDLEERGLLYRERQDRTYRIYPSEELETTEET